MERPQLSNTTQTTSTQPQKLVLKLKFKEDVKRTKTKDESEKENKPKNLTRKRVTWTEDTIDNEHMNKKKSNICCIYNPRRHTREYDEQYVPTCSSDENNELERSNQSKREHLARCSKRHRRHKH